MKSYIRRGALAAMLAVAAAGTAQNTRSGYFVEDYTYRFMMNPAMANSQNFVSYPGLGNLNVGMNGTLHVGDILYNVDGKTTTFLNPNVQSAEFLRHINARERIGADLRETVLAGGFKAWGGYNTVAISARASVGIKLPGELLRFLKEGVSNKTYNIGNINAFANAYAEILLGHSRQLSSEWRVGANLKVLLGAGNIDVRMKHAELTLNDNTWTARTEGKMESNIKNFHYKTKINSQTGKEYVDGFKYDSFGFDGLGFGLDLGVTYAPEAFPYWKFSASILDLGFICWDNNLLASTEGVKTFDSNDYTFSPDDNSDKSFSNEWKVVREDLKNLYQLNVQGDQGSQTRSLASSFHIGAEYILPYYKPLSFGVLNTTRIQGTLSWTEFRFSANIAPCKVFSASANMVAGTFGAGFGWLINVHHTGGNFFIGMDRTPGRLAKQGVPLNSNTQFNIGANVLF